MVHNTNPYPSLVSTLPKSICDKMAAKSDVYFYMEQLCVNTRIRLLTTLSSLNYEKCQTIQEFVEDEKRLANLTVGLPQASRKNKPKHGLCPISRLVL